MLIQKLIEEICFYFIIFVHEYFCVYLVLDANTHSPTNKRKSTELNLSKGGGDKYGYLREIHTKHKIKRQKTDADEQNTEGECRKRKRHSNCCIISWLLYFHF